MYILSHAIESSQEIQFVAKQTNQSCSQIFLKSAFLTKKKENYSTEDLKRLVDFSRAACLTSNPDIIWQIAYVESGFEMRVIGIPGKGKLVGSAAENFTKNLTSPINIDIGPIQINWRAHGFHSGFAPEQFFSGVFSLDYATKKIVPNVLRDCKSNWINCYNSKNQRLGQVYRKKIDSADIVLRKNLYSILKS